MLTTGKDIHEMYPMSHLQTIQWDEVSPIAKQIYESLAQAIELEKSCIIAVKCPKCEEMISAYGYAEHICKGETNG